MISPKTLLITFQIKIVRKFSHLFFLFLLKRGTGLLSLTCTFSRTEGSEPPKIAIEKGCKIQSRTKLGS